LRVPLFLVIAQWVLLFAFGTLLLVMYRQLGRAFHRPRTLAEPGPEVGTRAMGFEYTRVRDNSEQRVRPGEGRGMLLAFVDPTCLSCERLVEALNDADRAGQLADLDVLLLLSDPPSYLRISEAFTNTQLELGQITDQATIDHYKPTVTPLLVALDPVGTVAAAGSAVHGTEVQGFARAARSSTKAVQVIDVDPAAVNGHSITSATTPVAGPK
jgi:hypothetical protein